MVQPLWDAHICGAAVETQYGGQTKKGNGDVLTTERRGYGRELGVNVVQLVREGGVHNGGGGSTVQMPWASTGSNG